MKLKRLVGGNLESNGYIAYEEREGNGYLIDPGYQGPRYLKELDKLGVAVKAILLTHHHYDHVGAAAFLRKELGCPVCLHWDDCSMYKGEVDEPLSHGDRFYFNEEDVSEENLLVLHTPGHTRGSVCLFNEKCGQVFTGDTIFNVDLGRTDLEDGSPEDMKRSIGEVVAAWGNGITIYPGHGDSATMKYVRTYNKEFLDLLPG